MPLNNEKLRPIIEHICAAGCERVNEVIEILEHQQCIEETRGLDKQENKLILQELKAVMAVYDKK
ncbi:MAG: hypothetical protein OQK69_08485 [Gammaproteobacteria bacterium]|nr:hypothetical protein [Gammaproteobacteria bacterium]